MRRRTLLAISTRWGRTQLIVCAVALLAVVYLGGLISPTAVPAGGGAAPASRWGWRSGAPAGTGDILVTDPRLIADLLEATLRGAPGESERLTTSMTAADECHVARGERLRPRPPADCVHGYAFFGLCFCKPSYIGERCEARVDSSVTNPWYTADCPNLAESDTADVHVPLDKLGGDAGCSPNDPEFHTGLRHCAAWCYAHVSYGVGVTPHAMWAAAQKAEIDTWVGIPEEPADQDTMGMGHAGEFAKFKCMPSDIGEVLEVGAGPWTQFRYVLHNRPDLVAAVSHLTIFDPGVERMLKEGQSTAYTETTLRKPRSDETYPFPVKATGDPAVAFGKQYDTVLANNVVEHVQNGFEYYLGLWAVIKPGGILVMFERDWPNPVEADAILGANEYHPCRLHRVVLETFMENFEVLFHHGYSSGEPTHFIIARRKL